jgi:hypothetical protein
MVTAFRALLRWILSRLSAKARFSAGRDHESCCYLEELKDGRVDRLGAGPILRCCRIADVRFCFWRFTKRMKGAGYHAAFF